MNIINTFSTTPLTLYPGHWLYNAGVIGFLRVLEEDFGYNVTGFMTNGCVKLDRNIFLTVSSKYNQLHFSDTKKELKVTGKNKFHPNFWQGSWDRTKLKLFISSLATATTANSTCSFCVHPLHVDEASLIAQGVPQKFFEGISEFNNRILDMKMGSALTESPNAAWNLNTVLPICHLCAYLLLFAPLGLTDMQHNEHIFVNSPSFKVIWLLNLQVQTVLRRTKSIREILGLSLVQATIREQLTLHRWTAHNVEVVVKRGDKIEFVTVPGEIVLILNNREIAHKLNAIKELTILRHVLDQKWDMLLEVGYRLIRITRKENYSDPEREYIREWLPYNASRDPEILKSSSAGKRKLLNIAHQLLLLHAHIRETLKIH